MILRLLAISIFSFVWIDSHAQANKIKSFSLNLGPEVSFIETNLRKTHRVGYGASIKGEYTFGKHGSATINTGLSYFEGKSTESILAIPVKAGARYYLGNFYAAGEAGVVFLSKYFNETRPVFSIGMGDKFRVGAGKVDISLRQEFWVGNPNTISVAVLRVGYELGW